MERRRSGDNLLGVGDYHYRALTQGFVVQRFWHSLKFVTVDRLHYPSPDDTILDLGCGSGVVSNYLAESGASVYGLDGNPEAIDFATSQFVRENLRFQCALVDEVDFEDDSFDGIYCFEVIEHLYWEQIEKLFRLLHAKLKPGGRLLLTTPNYRSLWPLIEAFMDKANLAPKMAGEQHVVKPTRGKVRSLASSSGFEVEKLFGGFGIAPFLSPLGWKLALSVDRQEHRLGGPVGNLICASLRKPAVTV